MLTATYSIVTIAAEQDKARTVLSRLQQCLQSVWHGLQNVDLGFLDAAFNKLLQFDHYCRNRKVVLYLIPALRDATREADALITELEVLSARAADMLHAARRHLSGTIEISSIRASEVCHSMEMYCHSFSTRLNKEDELLLPIARRLLSVEEWFALAAKFLADEAQAPARRRRSVIASCASGKTTLNARAN